MKQKIVYRLFLLVTALAVFINLGCHQNTPVKTQTEAPKAQTKEGEKTGDKNEPSPQLPSKLVTEFPYELIDVNPPVEGIIGKDAECDKPTAQGYFLGVFIKDRKVKLSPYKIGKTPIPYGLWYEVKEWGKKNGYEFEYEGLAGSVKGAPLPAGKGWENVGKPPTEETKNLPVTMIIYADLIVWCNAYTEMNFGEDACVYRSKDNKVLKKSNAGETQNIQDCVADITKKGFRLPTEAEWEFAARYQPKGSAETNAEEYGTGVWLTKIYSVSGAEKPAPIKGIDIGKHGNSWENLRDDSLQFALYNQYFNGETWIRINKLPNSVKATEVGQKKPNQLGIYDMNGLVFEYCFDRTNGADNVTGYDELYMKDGFVVNPQGGPSDKDITNRISRGGSFSSICDYCIVGYRNATGFLVENNEHNSFRVVRTQ